MSSLENAYALLIGVGADLPASVRDAAAIAALLSNPEIAGYKKENIHLLTEEQATRDRILNAFDDLIDKVDENASVILFYSGHGGTYSDNDIIELEQGGKNLKSDHENQSHYYWVPNDFDPKNYRTTWLLATELKEKLQKLQTRRLILMLDCCHAEGMTKAGPDISKSTLKERLKNPEDMMHKIDDGRGMSILSSCRAEELSWIIPKDAPHSLFTKCLLEVLQGTHRDDFNEEYVRMTDVINHIMRKVPEIKSIQRPFVTLQMYDDFILSKNTNKNEPITQVADLNAVPSMSKETDAEIVTSFRENHGVNAALFIHGFSGQAHESFGVIPKLLAQDSQMDGWDLFPIGFSENFTPEMGHDIWASPLDLQKLADNIVSSFRYKFENYKRVALIGHSLGGLAVQQAILEMSPEERERISHVIFMGTPHKGLQINSNNSIEKRASDYDRQGSLITKLRQDWSQAFEERMPFKLANAIGTQDATITIDTAFGVFDPSNDILIEGDHFSMVQPEDTHHDGYQLIIKTLTDSQFAIQYTNKEEINLLLGNYDAVVRELWPDRMELGAKGVRNLLFALEGLDRLDDAIELAENKVEESESLHLFGLLAGRVKRRYLQTMKDADGDLSFKLYKKAYDMAVAENNNDQQYFLAINLAFLSLIHEEYRSMMQKYATLSRKLAQQDPFDSIWKAATIAESSMYLADFEAAKEQYAIAAADAGVREKISMHTNAYLAYTTLKQTTDDEFVRFLKRTFLS
ncbi:caspase family protein [Nonlabens marinus]|uniref:PGAP1-like protein n=1 Tax=Nonlabens marinus S1-08 TaxID=1454201 RepID=W8VWH5_9FLAO|nr:caspase family protein [Nonlabens marinus]BAO56348.1 hypothetical protein NMS_2339 [Nonlabens marinus S1-08]